MVNRINIKVDVGGDNVVDFSSTPDELKKGAIFVNEYIENDNYLSANSILDKMNSNTFKKGDLIYIPVGVKVPRELLRMEYKITRNPDKANVIILSRRFIEDIVINNKKDVIFDEDTGDYKLGSFVYARGIKIKEIDTFVVSIPNVHTYEFILKNIDKLVLDSRITNSIEKQKLTKESIKEIINCLESPDPSVAGIALNLLSTSNFENHVSSVKLLLLRYRDNWKKLKTRGNVYVKSMLEQIGFENKSYKMKKNNLQKEDEELFLYVINNIIESSSKKLLEDLLYNCKTKTTIEL